MSAIIPITVVNFQASRTRSHLAANQILIRLGQVFGGATFTSRRASNTLGLDFLYLAKVLFRMRRSNVLRVVAKEPRMWGGYENLYQISTHGFRKIRYLLAKEGLSGNLPTTPKQRPDLIIQGCASHYLLNGEGTVNELFGQAFFKIATRGVPITPATDEVGMLLSSLDPTFIPLETVGKAIIKQFPCDQSYAMTVMRATRLQELGHVPKNINLPLFVGNAMLRGSTDSVILLGLLLGSIKLKTEGEFRLGSTTHQSLLGQTGSLKCQNCKDYEHMMFEDQCKFRMLESENGLLKDRCIGLTQKLGQASLKALADRFSHWQQLQYMEGRIDRLLECLVIISKGLGKFPNNDPFVVLMRDFVQESLTIMGAMICLARDPYSEASKYPDSIWKFILLGLID